MNEKKKISTFNRISTMIIAAVFMLVGVITPVYGLSAERQDDSKQYEKSANSWRFENGCMITEEEPAMFSTRATYKAWSKTEDGFVSSNGKIIEGAVRKGIDVSEWQGKINWSKVKSDGIDFAIIRCGYGDNETDQDDGKWLRNVSECERLGIPYGVYIYSYANSTTHIKSEAAHVLRCLKEADADPDYPVYLDLEDSAVKKAGKTNIVKYAEIFCSTIENAGYEAGIYANLNWWDNILYSIPGNTEFADYDIWVAQYYSKCQYDLGEYRLWQCASDGKVAGITGKVDLNFEFELEYETHNSPRLITDENGNEIFIDREGNKLTSQWLKYRRKNFYADENGVKVTGIYQIGDNKYYIDSAKGKLISKWVTVDGKKYYFKKDGTMLTGYKTINNLNYFFDEEGALCTKDVITDGKVYKILSSGIAVIHTAKTTTEVNYRASYSTSSKKKGTYKKGKVVSVIRTKSNGWSKLSNGYWVQSKYLKKQTTYPRKAKPEEWIKVVPDNNGNDLFVDLEGNICSSQWIAYDKAEFYADENGIKIIGLCEIDGAKYYIDKEAGKLKSKWITIDDKQYYFKKDGTMLTGYNTISSYKYLFDENGALITEPIILDKKEYKILSSGVAVIHTAKTTTKVNYRESYSTKSKKKGSYKKGEIVSVIRTKSNGWSKLDNGYWVQSKYLKKQTTYPRKLKTEEWIKIVSDNNGNDMFVDIEGNICSSQWITYNKKEFYADEHGVKVTGLCEIDGIKYYIDREEGKLISKWVDVDGKRYYFKKDGAMLTGYKTIGSYKYLFDENGVLITESIAMDGKEYKIASNGVAIIHTAKTTTDVNYRESYSTSSKRIGTYKKGELVSVIRTKSNGWSKLDNGYWIMTKYLKKQTTYPIVL